MKQSITFTVYLIKGQQKFSIMKTTNNNQLLERLNSKGQIKTNFFNGYGWTDNTKKFKDFLISKEINFSIENIAYPSKFKQRFILI